MMRMFHKRFKLFAAALIMVIMTVSFHVPAWAEENDKVLRVAFPEMEGFSMTDSDGRRYGIIVDFLNQIAKYTGWEYEYVEASNESLIDDFLKGNYDLMGGTYYAEGYEKYFAYPQYHCGYSKLILLARRNDNTIKSYDSNSLNGKTIGVYKNNTENIRRLEDYLRINKLDCALKYYTYEDLQVTGNLTRFLKSGEVDLLLGNITEVGNDFFVALSIDSQPHYIVTTPGNQEVVDGLNMALEKYMTRTPTLQKNYMKNIFRVQRTVLLI